MYVSCPAVQTFWNVRTKFLWYGFHGASVLQPWMSAMHVRSAECGLQCLGQQNAFYGILCDGQTLYMLVPASKLTIHQWQFVSLLSHDVLWLAGDCLKSGLSPPLLDFCPTSSQTKSHFFCAAAGRFDLEYWLGRKHKFHVFGLLVNDIRKWETQACSTVLGVMVALCVLIKTENEDLTWRPLFCFCFFVL